MPRGLKNSESAKRAQPAEPAVKENLKKIRTKEKSAKGPNIRLSSSFNMLKARKAHNKPLVNPTGQFSRELTRLQEHWQPDSMSYREVEKEKIKTFIQEGEMKWGSTVALYITGLPGLGKTAAVFEVISKMNKNKNFDVYYINALKLSGPAGFYTQLWSQLTGIEEQPPKACRLLESYFRSKSIPQGYKKGILAENNRLANTKLLVIDEIDYLKSKKQDVLYNIFDWQHSKHAHLIIICIANTLNFHSLLLPKIQSRMGNNVLIFKPYSSQEIEGILASRLENSRVFKAETLKFIARKVANFSSDIRKSLHIARRALQLYINDSRGLEQINIDFVNDVFEAESQKPLVAYIRAAPTMFKMVLIAMIVEFKFTNSAFFDTELLFERLNNLLAQINSPAVEYYLYRLALDRCRDLRIVKINYDSQVRPRIEFIAESDEVGFALRDDPIFNKFGNLKAIYAT